MPVFMKNNCIILFIKAPKPGFVKTRLAKDIGTKKACSIYIKLAEKILKEAKKTKADIEIHYFPEKDMEVVKSWIGTDFKFYPQQGDGLGNKMKNSIFCVLKKGYKKVILAGSDIPELNREIFESGFENIDKNPVIGPCEDGGYYLIGVDAESFKESYFQNIKWSTDTVLKDTVKKMKKAGFRPYLLPLLNDIDTIDDLCCKQLPKPEFIKP